VVRLELGTLFFRMITDFIEMHPTGVILATQTTYLTLEVKQGLFKIEFRGKAEFRLKKGARGALGQYTQHPLLLDHNEPRGRLYLNSRPTNPSALLEDIKQRIAHVSENWRSLPFYLFRWNQAGALALVQQNIAQGSGILLDFAPVSIVRAVVATCEQHGVATKFFGPLEPAALVNELSVLFIGSCYVIAKEFYVQPA
jgi:hypothetical protein